MATFKWKELDAWYVNLRSRPDRNIRMRNELRRIGFPAQRFEARKPHQWEGPESDVAVMRKRTPGAIGCYDSQMRVMRKSLVTGRNVLILEDDVIFADDFKTRLQYIEDHLTWDWDIFWLGATFHLNPPVWHKDTLGRDVECTNDPRILRTYGIWSTYAWIVNSDSVAKVDKLFQSRLHESWGIDHLAIMLQPQLKTYCFVPGCTWQYDNRSDIGRGTTRFSGFNKLGPFAWKRFMNDFDPAEFDWAEADIDSPKVRVREDLGQLLKSHDLLGDAAEIGVAEGLFSSNILNWGVRKLYLVDGWTQFKQKGDGGYSNDWHNANLVACEARVKDRSERTHFLRGQSSEMAQHVPDASLSFLYIDGDHSYEGVKRDLEAWLPKVKPGGLIAGHDFLNPAYGVNRAVKEFTDNRFKVHLIPDIGREHAGYWFFNEKAS